MKPLIKFTLGQVLTVYTGIMLCDVADIYIICNEMTGDNLLTHQLCRAMDVLSPAVKEQQPWVAQIKLPEFEQSKEVKPWVLKQQKKYGNSFKLKPVKNWVVKNPIIEWAKMKCWETNNV